MPWSESVHLTTELSADPSSHVAAAVNGWDHPISREALVLMDLFDLQYAKAADKKSRLTPYPRPWPDRRGKTTEKPTVSQEVVQATLRKASGRELLR